MLSLAWIIKKHIYIKIVYSIFYAFDSQELPACGTGYRDLSEKQGAKTDNVKSEIGSKGNNSDGKVLALQA